jgi:hypothetical protein
MKSIASLNKVVSVKNLCTSGSFDLGGGEIPKIFLGPIFEFLGI